MKITVRVQVDAGTAEGQGAERFSEVFVLEREQLTEASVGVQPDRSPHAAHLDSGNDDLRAGHGGRGRAEPLRAMRASAPSQGHPNDHRSHAVRDAAPGQSAVHGLSVSSRCRGPATFSPLAVILAQRGTPELVYPQARFAAMMSFDLAAHLLGEVLPLGGDPCTPARSVTKSPW